MGHAVKFKDYMKRLFIRYTIALIILMFCVFMGSMLLNYQLVIIKANEDCNQLVSSFISEQYGVYQNGITDLSHHDIVQQALFDRRELREVNRLLYEFCLSQQIKGNFVLLDHDGQMVSSNLYKSNQQLFLANRAVNEALAQLRRDPVQTFCAVLRNPLDFGQKSDLLFARAVQADTGELIGFLLFSWREESLSAFLRNRDADIMVITDRFNNVIFSTNSLLIDSMGKYQSEQPDENWTSIDQKPYYVTTSSEPTADMKIITMTSVAKQQQLVEFGGLFLIGISCFFIALVRVVADKVTARHISSVDELLLAVSECQKGNIAYRIKSQTFEEFQTLYDDFNNMMLKLQQLIKNNDELAERKRWMEVKNLEAQFNPHFVFNVLEALRYVILTDPAQASNMVVAFANLMRYSINYGSTHVSLQTDIGYVKDYLLLQKMRYGQRLGYDIIIEEALLPCKVPKLLIQPIVENSIVHGLENAGQLTIRITGRVIGKDLVICVEDNGPGMTADRLASLQAILSDENAMPKRIGLYNVHRALQLLYGENYGLTLESNYGHGLRVILKAPLILEADNV